MMMVGALYCRESASPLGNSNANTNQRGRILDADVNLMSACGVPADSGHAQPLRLQALPRINSNISALTPHL